MPKVSTLQSDFSGGEFAPDLVGRVDSDRYKKSLRTCLNYLPTVQGPATRRPGTSFVFPTKNNAFARLQSFEFSTLQAYILEFGNNYIRFFKDNAVITLTPQTISNITQANPAVVTYVGADTYANGDRIILNDVAGMSQVNNREFVVAGVNTGANTFQLSGVNSTGYDAYTSGGTAAEIYEIASVYGTADLAGLKFTQSADILYIVHPNYKPKKLLRYGHTDWQFVDLNLIDGPYLSTNTTPTALAPAAATGSGVALTVSPVVAITNAANNGSGLIRITAAAHGYLSGDKVYISGVTGTTEANGTWFIVTITPNTFDLRNSAFVNAYVAAGTAQMAIFASTDVGRSIRMKEGTTWGWAVIVSFVNPASVTIDIMETLTNTNAKGDFRLGVFSETTGYPAAITFHEDRLILGGADGAPQRIDGSKSGEYEVFSPTDFDGTVSSNNGIGFAFNANDVNAIRWLTSDEKGLIAGTVAGEWITRPSTQNEGLTPSNITAKRSTSWGSEDVSPVQAGKATLFVQRAGHKVRELNYYFDVDGFRATDLTQLATHILPYGVRQMAYQKEPQGFVWAVRNDGVLAAMTYDRDLDNLRAGWHRHVIGGVSDAAGSDTIVESVQVIPSSDGLRQDMWLIVKRYINGSVVRYVEYLTKLFEDTDEQRDAFFVDSGLTFDNPITITGITKANPGVVTAPSHGLANGDKILILDVLGMSEVNDLTFIVSSAAANTFQLKNPSTLAVIDTSSFTTYVSGGTVRKMITTISGLNHLEGQQVDILADGAVMPPQTVTNGKITLTEKSATVQIGFGYVSQIELLRAEAGAEDGTALGKTRRTHRTGILLHRSIGIKIGMGFTKLTTITFRKTSTAYNKPPGLFTGILSESLAANYDFDNYICFQQDQPLPSTILAVMPQMVEQDRG